MRLEPGRRYRAKTAAGELMTFRVIKKGDGPWVNVDLLADDGPEPHVWLNTALLLWISTEEQQEMALAKATEETIEALEEGRES
jgi:hypothetical protein